MSISLGYCFFSLSFASPRECLESDWTQQSLHGIDLHSPLTHFPSVSLLLCDNQAVMGWMERSVCMSVLCVYIFLCFVPLLDGYCKGEITLYFLVLVVLYNIIRCMINIVECSCNFHFICTVTHLNLHTTTPG